MLCAYGAGAWRFSCPHGWRKVTASALKESSVAGKRTSHNWLIAVDCGTGVRALKSQTIRARGADVIVLDHHEPKGASSGLHCDRQS